MEDGTDIGHGQEELDITILDPVYDFWKPISLEERKLWGNISLRGKAKK